MTARHLVYAYAVARRTEGLQQAVAAIVGVASSPVELVPPTRGHDPVAITGPVPAGDFGEDALRTHLEELPWLETLARVHHTVVEAVARHTTVLPLRLATVYLDDERVRSMLDERQDMFLARLAELAGRVEWGVKLYLDDAALQPASTPDDISPGRAYLLHRRAEQHHRQDAYEVARTAVERVDAAAGPHAVDRVRHRVQQGELAAGPGTNVANDAYLVPEDHAAAFRADVLRSADGLPGVRVVITGPWAPYSFAGLEQNAARPNEQDAVRPDRGPAS
ncbi:GvpL/GvpF family gas vesicle protein [Kitasatospora sp. NBC_01539]|uniref:GvpL/GvpF family gas vesicle protein n=1 Tax=Kitasatospora sp. NBC_01539 TaxID=2903577 RepID=UPI0038600DAF